MYTQGELEKKLKKELVQICETLNIVVFSKDTKADLIARILGDSPSVDIVESSGEMPSGQAVKEPLVEDSIIDSQPEQKLEVPEESDTVLVRVKTGTLQWEEGTFSKGDVFTTSKMRAARFDASSVEIVK